MLVTSPMLTFDSAAFPVAEGEDAETNPGIFGKALADWLAVRLKERGIATNVPFAEDWGWCLELANQKHRTGLACASDDGATTTWHIYAFSDPGLFGGLRGKDAYGSAVNGLLEHVKGILANERSITNLRIEEMHDS
jgi:hypothetical protein